MIHFSEIANPPKPVYRPMCVACDGRGVVPSLKATQKCDKCNGTGKQMMTPLQAIEQEIKRLNAQSYEPSSASILALIQMLVDVLKEGNTPLSAEE
jgi:hypothetical protein